MENDTELIAVYTEDKQLIYSNIENIDNLEIKEILNPEKDIYCLRKLGTQHYMLFSSHWSINNKIIYLVNTYNANSLYEERQRQIKEILFTDVIILIVSTIVISVFSRFLTKPINILNNTSKEIASGQFNKRVYINRNDEIGELARNFNIMAEEIENKIKQLNLQVKQKNDFINGFTHELKTPMTAIVGYSEMLRLKKCDEELSKKALNYIYSESKRLENLSFKLMQLMSLTEEKIELSNIDIEEFMKKIAKKSEIMLTKNKLELKLQKAIIIGDSELLEVVIRNLIENANKAEPKDHKIKIIGEKVNNEKYRIYVIDRGRGIPKEHIERVTEDFYMVDKSRSRSNGGSGIGLALVKKILELHNSELKIKSKVNEGTIIYFELKEVVL